MWCYCSGALGGPSDSTGNIYTYRGRGGLLIIPNHTIPYHTVPYHTIPYHTIPYRTVSYHTIPYHRGWSRLRPNIQLRLLNIELSTDQLPRWNSQHLTIFELLSAKVWAQEGICRAGGIFSSNWVSTSLLALSAHAGSSLYEAIYIK